MDEFRNYQHVTPPLRVFSGANCLDQLDRELKRLGVSRAMIFTGNTLGKKGSPLEHVKTALGDKLAGVFAGVRAHSPLPDVEEAARALRETGADGAIAVGGGSAIVTARAASILLAEGKSAHDLATATTAEGKMVSPRLDAVKIPQIIVPTTPTTAIVKAGSAVFDPASKTRLPMFDPKTRAQSVFIHPDLVGSSPARLVVSASLNTLSMAIEGLMARGGTPIADSQLMHALRLAYEGLNGNGEDPAAAARADLVVAAMLCGQGTDQTGAGIVTVLGHAIGVPFNIENGIANAVVLPHAIRFNAPYARGGLGKIAAALGLASGEPGLIVARLSPLFEALGIPPRLRDLGVPREALPEISAHAMGDWFLKGNPKPISDSSEILGVLEAAW